MGRSAQTATSSKHPFLDSDLSGWLRLFDNRVGNAHINEWRREN